MSAFPFDSPPRALVLDVDGVLTDNRIYLDGEGRESKAFYVPDGQGLRWLMEEGIEVIMVSGRRSAVVENRARELGIRRAYSGIHDKVAKLEGILAELGIRWADIAYVGDDLIDLASVVRAGRGIAVANAHPAVRDAACYVTQQPGGQGAVREICELVLQSTSAWSRILERYHP